MKYVKSSCGSRGCYISDRILPIDSKPVIIYSKMHGERNDISKVLFDVNLFLDKMEKKAA